jgi:hypothetical protein
MIRRHRGSVRDESTFGPASFRRPSLRRCDAADDLVHSGACDVDRDPAHAPSDTHSVKARVGMADEVLLGMQFRT